MAVGIASAAFVGLLAVFLRGQPWSHAFVTVLQNEYAYIQVPGGIISMVPICTTSRGGRLTGSSLGSQPLRRRHLPHESAIFIISNSNGLR